MRVLVIRFSSFGDCVLLCPFLERVRTTPGVEEVAVLTRRTYAELFAAASGANRVVAIDGSFAGLRRAITDLAGGGYTVLDAHASLRSRIVRARLGGAAACIEKHTAARLNLIVFKNRRQLPTMLERYAALGRAINADTAPLQPGGLVVPEAAAARARASLPETAGLVAMAPGSRWQSKRWPGFSELAADLVKSGRRLVLLGDASDSTAANAIVERVGTAALDLTGRATFLETAAHLARCGSFVGNDSGLMHLSEAVGTPVVGVFGPTVREFGYFPSLPASRTIERTLACRPCSRNGSTPCPRGTTECLTRIPVAVVRDAIFTLHDSTAPRRVVID